MVFTEESALVQTWVRLIKNNVYSESQVPALGNLKEIVYKAMSKK